MTGYLRVIVTFNEGCDWYDDMSHCVSDVYLEPDARSEAKALMARLKDEGKRPHRAMIYDPGTFEPVRNAETPPSRPGA